MTGSDTVVFRLEDGALVKARVEIARAGVAINFKSPDGTPCYDINAELHVQVVPSSKTFYKPKSQFGRPPPKEPKMKPI